MAHRTLNFGFVLGVCFLLVASAAGQSTTTPTCSLKASDFSKVDFAAIGRECGKSRRSDDLVPNCVPDLAAVVVASLSRSDSDGLGWGSYRIGHQEQRTSLEKGLIVTESFPKYMPHFTCKSSSHHQVPPVVVSTVLVYIASPLTN
jgi:hypothetical protein